MRETSHDESVIITFIVKEQSLVSKLNGSQFGQI